MSYNNLSKCFSKILDKAIHWIRLSTLKTSEYTFIISEVGLRVWKSVKLRRNRGCWHPCSFRRDPPLFTIKSLIFTNRIPSIVFFTVAISSFDVDSVITRDVLYHHNVWHTMWIMADTETFRIKHLKISRTNITTMDKDDIATVKKTIEGIRFVKVWITQSLNGTKLSAASQASSG
jgi:hypothetical protein